MVTCRAAAPNRNGAGAEPHDVSPNRAPSHHGPPLRAPPATSPIPASLSSHTAHPLKPTCSPWSPPGPAAVAAAFRFLLTVFRAIVEGKGTREAESPARAPHGAGGRQGWGHRREGAEPSRAGPRLTTLPPTSLRQIAATLHGPPPGFLAPPPTGPRPPGVARQRAPSGGGAAPPRGGCCWGGRPRDPLLGSGCPSVSVPRRSTSCLLSWLRT